MRLIKAVIFDFDGTIINTEAAVFETYKKFLREEYRYDLSLKEFSMIVGTTDDVLLNIVDETLETPIDRKHFAQNVKEELYRAREDLVLRTGFLDVLKKIQAQDVQLALASSSGRIWIDDFLEKHQLKEYFPIIHTADDVDEVKPHPALYTKSVEALGLDKEDVFAVEDSANGSLAAVRAGLNCLVIPNSITAGSTFHENTQIINSYDEFDLSHYLKKAAWKK